jgi:hypothetical protein
VIWTERTHVSNLAIGGQLAGEKVNSPGLAAMLLTSRSEHPAGPEFFIVMVFAMEGSPSLTEPKLSEAGDMLMVGRG